MASDKSPPLLHGVVLVAGGAVGAGMFALPMAAAGAGFAWAVVGMVVVWLMTYIASLVLLEVNSSFSAGVSFNTLVTERLGSRWALANNLAITFIMMVLMYAYTTAGASILEPLLNYFFEAGVLSANGDAQANYTKGLLSIFFALIVSLIVWLGTKVVSVLSAVLLTAMVLTFFVANAGLAPHIALNSLEFPFSNAVEKLKFLWFTLPIFVTAFACASLVPSLVKHYNKELIKVKKSLFFGTLVSLILYVMWLSTTLGTLDDQAFEKIALAGGRTGDLVDALQAVQVTESQNTLLPKALNVFSNFAIITSFLSIGLGLFHFIADRFNWSDRPLDKSKSIAVAFIPPTLMSFFSPFGFVSAIGYAGLAVVFSFFIVPVLMLKQQRQLNLKHPSTHSPVAASSPALLVLLLFSSAIIALKLATIFDLLPRYP